MDDALETRPEGDDYEVIRVSISWGALSILAFIALMTLQVFGFRVFGLRLGQLTAATLALAFAGFVLGLIGTRLGRARRAAKVGLFLNGVVLFCVFVLMPLTFQVLRSLR